MSNQSPIIKCDKNDARLFPPFNQIYKCDLDGNINFKRIPGVTPFQREQNKFFIKRNDEIINFLSEISPLQYKLKMLRNEINPILQKLEVLSKKGSSLIRDTEKQIKMEKDMVLKLRKDYEKELKKYSPPLSPSSSSSSSSSPQSSPQSSPVSSPQSSPPSTPPRPQIPSRSSRSLSDIYAMMMEMTPAERNEYRLLYDYIYNTLMKKNPKKELSGNNKSNFKRDFDLSVFNDKALLNAIYDNLLSKNMNLYEKEINNLLKNLSRYEIAI